MYHDSAAKARMIAGGRCTCRSKSGHSLGTCPACRETNFARELGKADFCFRLAAKNGHACIMATFTFNPKLPFVRDLIGSMHFDEWCRTKDNPPQPKIDADGNLTRAPEPPSLGLIGQKCADRTDYARPGIGNAILHRYFDETLMRLAKKRIRDGIIRRIAKRHGLKIQNARKLWKPDFLYFVHSWENGARMHNLMHPHCHMGMIIHKDLVALVGDEWLTNVTGRPTGTERHAHIDGRHSGRAKRSRLPHFERDVLAYAWCEDLQRYNPDEYRMNFILDNCEPLTGDVAAWQYGYVQAHRMEINSARYVGKHLAKQRQTMLSQLEHLEERDRKIPSRLKNFVCSKKIDTELTAMMLERQRQIARQFVEGKRDSCEVHEIERFSENDMALLPKSLITKMKNVQEKIIDPEGSMRRALHIFTDAMEKKNGGKTRARNPVPYPQRPNHDDQILDAWAMSLRTKFQEKHHTKDQMREEIRRSAKAADKLCETSRGKLKIEQARNKILGAITQAKS